MQEQRAKTNLKNYLQSSYQQ